MAHGAWTRTRIVLVVLLLAGCATPDGQTNQSMGPASTCMPSPEQLEGPYFLPAPEKSDIRTDAVGAQEGRLLHLNLTVLSSQCRPLEGARVDLWHANATGVYSGFEEGAGRLFLRGHQNTDSSGQVIFTTIWPGRYPGRAVHLHVKVTAAAQTWTSQLYFPDDANDGAMAAPPYAGKGMSNGDDHIYYNGGSQLLINTQTDGPGFKGSKQLVVPMESMVVPAPPNNKDPCVSVAPSAWYGTLDPVTIEVSGKGIKTPLRFETSMSLSFNAGRASFNTVGRNQVDGGELGTFHGAFCFAGEGPQEFRPQWESCYLYNFTRGGYCFDLDVHPPSFNCGGGPWRWIGEQQQLRLEGFDVRGDSVTIEGGLELHFDRMCFPSMNNPEPYETTLKVSFRTP